MTPQEYQLTTTLASGSATWRHYVRNLVANPQIVNISNYGAFFSTATQNSGGVNSANKVLLDSVDTTNGISLVNNGLVISNAGQYLINWLGQFKFVGGGSSTQGNITTWYTINGVAAPNSSFTFFLPSTNQFQVLTNVEDINSFNVGDRVEFYWWSDIPQNGSNYVSLNYTPAASNPTRPASPSAKVTISQLN